MLLLTGETTPFGAFMPSKAPSQKSIAILGAGRIGSTLGFQLARIGGHAVTLIARTGSVRLEQLKRDGGIVTVKGERADVGIADRFDEQAPYDLVIVTLLAHQAAPLLPNLQRSAAKEILFMFNMFDPEAISSAVGAERCTFGMPFLQADYDGNGRLVATIGAAGQKSLIGRQSLVDLFRAAGLPAAFESDMPLWLRCHAPLCVAFQSACCAGENRRGGCSWGEARVVARGVKAAFDLIRAMGYSTYPASKTMLSRAPIWLVAGLFWAVTRNRSFRELLATGRLEACALIDSMLSAATGSTRGVQIARIEAMRPL
jgi:2-dehydropantoate 2-reductase